MLSPSLSVIERSEAMLGADKGAHGRNTPVPDIAVGSVLSTVRLSSTGSVSSAAIAPEVLAASAAFVVTQGFWLTAALCSDTGASSSCAEGMHRVAAQRMRAPKQDRAGCLWDTWQGLAGTWRHPAGWQLLAYIPGSAVSNAVRQRFSEGAPSSGPTQTDKVGASHLTHRFCSTATVLHSANKVSVHL